VKAERAPDVQHLDGFAVCDWCAFWDGDPATLPRRGIDAVLEDGVACLCQSGAPTAACALMIVVVPDRLGKGM
jgi:hypothetical protein